MFVDVYIRTYVCLHLVLNHMFHLCLFGVRSTLLQKVHFALANCTAGRVSTKCVFFTHVIVTPFFAVHAFLLQLANTDTSFVVLCMCNVYTWYVHAGTVCVLVQFSP